MLLAGKVAVITGAGPVMARFGRVDVLVNAAFPGTHRRNVLDMVAAGGGSIVNRLRPGRHHRRHHRRQRRPAVPLIGLRCAYAHH